MSDNEMYCSTIVMSRKVRSFEATPEFSAEEVIFHPVLKEYQHIVQEKEVWAGVLMEKTRTEKKDKRGVPIFIQFFKPERKVRSI